MCDAARMECAGAGAVLVLCRTGIGMQVGSQRCRTLNGPRLCMKARCVELCWTSLCCLQLVLSYLYAGPNSCSTSTHTCFGGLGSSSSSSCSGSRLSYGLMLSRPLVAACDTCTHDPMGWQATRYKETHQQASGVCTACWPGAVKST